MMAPAIRHPTAWLPIAMSTTALAMTLIYVAIVGVAAARQPDEGTAAHLFQLLMAGQVPLLALFAMIWLPRAPVTAVKILAAQLAAAVAAFVPVYWFGL